MVVEIVNTGSELLLGRVLNTHQQWLCRHLADLGYTVAHQVAVPDTGADIQVAVREALSRADLVITTGGLGPTSDDLTREFIAKLLCLELVYDELAMAQIRRFFEQRNRPVPTKTWVEAQVPRGAIVFPNLYGTAPGLALKAPAGKFRPGPNWLIMLPGPPRELRPMFLDSALPLIERELPLPARCVCRTLRTTGIGESMVEERVAPALQGLTADGLELGYCARPGQVDVRLVAHGDGADRRVREAEATVRAKLAPHVFGVDDEELEALVVRLLTERKAKLALAESCTGGCIAHRLTNVPGASAVLLAGVVAYSNAAKRKFLGVRAETLEQHGAVSEPVAKEMAEGARRETGADYALSATGIAGPSGGTPDKPVGTVFIGMADPFDTCVVKNLNPWDRETFKNVTAQQALDLLRGALVPS